MAGEEFDIGQLTADQQLALQQYTSVTDQALDAAVPLLMKCEWNVQIAIARFFDGEPAQPIADETPTLLPPASARRQEVLINSRTDQRTSASSRFESAPRLGSQSESQRNPRAGPLLSLFLTPANIIFNLFSRVFGIFSYLFPFLPSLVRRLTRGTSGTALRRHASERRPLGPQDTTARFLREFEEEYGSNNLPFLVTGYARAFDSAKLDLKFLLVIPLSPEHDDTAPFVRDVLLTETVTNFLNDSSNNILLWAGSVQDSETYQVASTLNISTFPSATLIAHTPSVSSTAMSVVARITGPTTPERFIATLAAAIRQNSGELTRIRSMRAEQQAGRDIREQQNTAYERSLAADRDRARIRREAEAARQMAKAEQEKQQYEKQRYEANLAQWRRWRADSIAEEPDASNKDAVRINVRLLNGERVMHRFLPDADIEEIYAFVECYDIRKEATDADPEKLGLPGKPADFEHEYLFRLVSPLPREVYDAVHGGKIGQRIGRSGNLVVERVVDIEHDSEEVEDDVHT